MRALISTVAQVMPDAQTNGLRARTDDANVSVVLLKHVAYAPAMATWKAFVTVVVYSVVTDDASVREDVFPSRKVL
jgi:hypothetical protein